MAVTEIALLKGKNLTHNADCPTIQPEVLRNLRHAASEQATFSGYPVALLQSQTIPSLMYLLGGWRSVAQHMGDWIPGPTNQQLLALLADDVEVKWLFHVDIDPLAVLGAVAKQKDGGGVVLTLGRHVVKQGQRAALEKMIAEEPEDTLDGFSDALCGWRVDLGYVAEGNTPGIQQVENTLITFGVSGPLSEGGSRGIHQGLAGDTEEEDVQSLRLVYDTGISS